MKYLVAIVVCFITHLVFTQNFGSDAYSKTFFGEDLDFCDNSQLVLVFEDNFDGDSLNSRVWELQPWGASSGDFNTSQEYNILSNSEVSNGTLKIHAKKETVTEKCIWWMDANATMPDGQPNYRQFDYTSSNLWSKFTFGEGYFEARVKIPKGKGFFPAFWTYSSGPISPWNEIDIFEFWNELDWQNNYTASKLSKIVNMTLHSEISGHHIQNACPKFEGVDFSEDFHVFGAYWDNGRVNWFLDGVLIGSQQRLYQIFDHIPVCSAVAFEKYFYNITIPKDPMHIIFNLAIQSGIDKHGNNKCPDESTPFPSTMEIDWVRFYQHSSCDDLYISSSEEIKTPTGKYNAITGHSVTINCNYTLQENNQLDLIANSFIDLYPGFTVDSGGIFSGVIYDWTCPRDKAPKSEVDNSDYNEESLSIYPNPSNGILTIEFERDNKADFEIRIYDILGQEINYVQIKRLVNKYELSLPHCENGNYILHLEDKKSNQTMIGKFTLLR